MHLSDIDLTVGDRYSTLELRERFGRGRAPRGIEICYDESGQRYLRLFATKESRYRNEFRPDGTIRYIGEDPPASQTADQELSGGNEALIESIDNPIPIFFFRRATSYEEWLFIGRVRVVNYEYTAAPAGDRKIFAFKLEPIG